MVRVKGLEPPRQRRLDLNQVRLPIPPHPHTCPIWTIEGLAKVCAGCEGKMRKNHNIFKWLKKLANLARFIIDWTQPRGRLQ